MVELADDWKDILEEGTTFELAAVVLVAPVDVVKVEPILVLVPGWRI